MTELKRAAEMFLVDYIKASLTSFPFYPSRGGGNTEEAEAIEPPFGVVMIDSSEHPLGSDVWLLKGHVVWVTHMDRQGVIQVSGEVRQLHDVLKAVPAGLDPAHGIMVHGMDIDSTDEFSDGDRQARGDLFSFTIGITQL